MQTRAQKWVDPEDSAEHTRPCPQCGTENGMWADSDCGEGYCFECGAFEVFAPERKPGVVQACPRCDSSAIQRRKTKSPTWRCVNGHTFENPELREKKSYDER